MLPASIDSLICLLATTANDGVAYEAAYTTTTIAHARLVLRWTIKPQTELERHWTQSLES